MRALFLLALAGCPWVGKGELSERLDADGDGVEGVDVGGADCDDTDPEVFPGRTERCNGRDDDCDGAVDEGTGDEVEGGVPFAIDDDGDGHGGEGVVIACVAPEGTAPAGDCDDTDAQRHPGAPERCDGVDEDCDGVIDDDAVDAPSWYPDDDGDGFGDPARRTLACSAPAGLLADGTDCDDADPGLNPDTTWYTDRDRDGWGDQAVDVGCVGPQGSVRVEGDCDDDDDAVHPEAGESCAPGDEDCDGLEGDADPDRLDPSTWWADADGDGFGDAARATEACVAPVDHVGNPADCDDAQEAWRPGAVWHVDADGDGYGGPSTTVACAMPPGHTRSWTDCDDRDASIHPGAQEVCDDDDRDEDCDGDADDDDPDAAGGSSWFFDDDGDGWGAGPATLACDPPGWDWEDRDGDCDDTDRDVHPETIWRVDGDGDGFGRAGTEQVQCQAPPASVNEPELDCDDTDPSVSPDAEELCNGVDEDCDGEIDEGADGDEAPIWYKDTDGDGFGDERSTKQACVQPVDYAPFFGDCALSDPTRYPGAPDPCYDGVDSDCDGGDDRDCDRDGYRPFFEGGEDCDDDDPLVNPASPTTRTVPGDHPTLQQALDEACEGDTIEVGPGTFVGPFVTARRVTLAGAGRGLTFLDGQGQSQVLVSLHGLTLTDLTLTGGVGIEGGCLEVSEGVDAVHVARVDAIDCQANAGGCFNIESTPDLRIEDVVLTDCRATVGAGGATLVTVNGRLDRVEVHDALGGYGSGLFASSSVLDIDDLLIADSVGYSALGAVAVGGTWTDLVLDHCSGDLIAGIQLASLPSDGTPLTLTDVQVIAPSTGPFGTLALYADVPGLVVSRMQVVGGSAPASPYFVPNIVNVGASSAAGTRIGPLSATHTPGQVVLRSGLGSSITLEHATLVGTRGGVVVQGGSGSATLADTIVAHTTEGPGLTQASGALAVRGTDLFGNAGGDWPAANPWLGADGNVSLDPELLSWGPSIQPGLADLRLHPASPLVDAATDPGPDPDGSPADVGYFGGPDAPFDATTDADGDGLYDTWEIRFGLLVGSLDDGDDPDGDGLSNLDEFLAGTHPTAADTDRDGVSDPTELASGTDPLDAADP